MPTITPTPDDLRGLAAALLISHGLIAASFFIMGAFHASKVRPAWLSRMPRWLACFFQ